MSQIGVQQTSRWDALTSLAKLTRDYSAHEYGTMMAVIEKRKAINSSSSPEEVTLLRWAAEAVIPAEAMGRKPIELAVGCGYGFKPEPQPNNREEKGRYSIMKRQEFNCKKLMVLGAALCLGLTACGAKTAAESQGSGVSQEATEPQTVQESQTVQETETAEEPQEAAGMQITMEQVIEANSTEKLLSHYHSAYEVSPTMRRYVETEFRYYNEDGVKEEIQMPDTVYGLYDGQYWGQLTPGGVWNSDSEYYAYFGLDHEATALEEIEKIEDNGDTLMLYTVLQPDSLSAKKDTLGIDYRDGDWIECSYKLDSETLAILETENVQCHADGTKEEPSTVTVTYDAPRPEGALALLERLSDKQNLRTITMILNPGTEKESSDSVYVQKGEGVMLINPEGKTLEVFKDSACTEPYTGGADTNKDLTIYGRFE